MLNLEVDLAQQVINMIVLVTILVLIIVSILGLYFYTKKRMFDSGLSFRDSMSLTELPVVTFYNGHKKLNFLLDTGSSECIINKTCLDSMWYTETEGYKEVFGMEGNAVRNAVISTIISYSGLKFDVEMVAMDMAQAFGAIKKESGVTIHGILGSNFFSRYKYVLDFDKLMFYKK